MRLILLLAMLAWPFVAGANPVGSPSGLCRAAIAAAERSMAVPDRLMQAVGAVESGRRDESGMTTAWPWTINAEGTGAYFASKAEAIAAVLALRARGVRSIDVGCMQINLMHHPDAFASLEEAFDPAANARYAATFLLRLLAQTGSWPNAVAGYHSLTPDIGAEYSRKVLAVWARPAPRGPPGDRSGATRQASGKPPGSPPADGAADGAGLQAWASSAGVPPASTTLSIGGSARVIPLPSAPSGTAVGRGLEAYRAMPTRLAARMMPGRGTPNS